MRADYESRADTIEIALESVDRLDYGEPVAGGRVIVHFRDDRPAMIDVIGTQHGFEETLRRAAERYGLDAETLVAVARAALAVPDRPVRLDVGARVAA